MKNKIIQLEKQLKDYAYAYYTLDNPTVSDEYYDQLYQELLSLYQQFPDELSNDSITRTIGYATLDKFDKQEHEYPMYSLDNAFNENDLFDFEQRISKEIKVDSYVVEPKIDGLAISLIYRQGHLVTAVTRGDGRVGEDVTNNVKTIKDIPIKLAIAIDIVVRGEVYLKRSVFEELNEQQKMQGLNPLANPRNAAAGSLRQLDSKVCANRKLSAYVYGIANYEQLNITSQQAALAYLKKLGFMVNEQIEVVNNIELAITSVHKIAQQRASNDYDIDGSVIKVNDFSLQSKLGFTTKSPKFAIAFKFPAKQVTTIMQDIVYTVGRTGQVTPNALLTSVLVDGSVVSKATLHNIDYIKERDIRIGDTVVIHKAGDIIPEVVKVVLEARKPNAQMVEMITECPVCHQPLAQVDGSVDYYCLNEQCQAKQVENIIHFVSRNAMNIIGLGEKVIESLFLDGLITNISDIYLLEKKEGSIVDKEGFGQKSFDNMITSINESKKRSLDCLLFGLGIRHVGQKTAKVLTKHFPSITELQKASYEQLISIDEIGDKIAKSIINYFQQESNQKLLADLKAFGVQMEVASPNKILQESFFTNKRIVITGSLQLFTRNELIALLEFKQAKVSGSVSRQTDLLICGDKAGSKKTKAEQLGISIIEESQLKEILDKEMS